VTETLGRILAPTTSRKRVTQCRSCHAGGLVEIIDLGRQRLADFTEDAASASSAFPLVLLFCNRCGLAQLSETVPRELMYHERYGFKSGVNESIRADLADIVTATLAKMRPDSWLDIASNDGTLLSFVPDHIYRVGVDPVEKYCREAVAHADEIVNDFFPSAAVTGMFDVVSSVSVFYDLDDPNAFVDAVANVLAPEGIWVVQQNYLADTVALNAVDNICHEHVTYFSLAAMDVLLSRHGLEVVDVTLSPVNGGCFRTFIAHKGTWPVSPRVGRLRKREIDEGLRAESTLHEWADRVDSRLSELRAFVDAANSRGERVAIYGASTRGGTIWQTAGFTADDFCYAVDRNPEKVGRTMASLGVPIVSEEFARDDRPDYMVVSIWFFRDAVIERESAYLAGGGQLVFPLPEFQLVG
jgi:NDP-4-keto-2,6-dideoxyhexose 3-C-methyltransferase